MNELQFYNRDDPAHLQGFREIIVNEGGVHPFMDAWWPPGHSIGWEHTFVHEIKDFLEAASGNRKVSPDFKEGVKVQAVLEASSESARSGRWRKVPKV